MWTYAIKTHMRMFKCPIKITVFRTWNFPLCLYSLYIYIVLILYAVLQLCHISRVPRHVRWPECHISRVPRPVRWPERPALILGSPALISTIKTHVKNYFSNILFHCFSVHACTFHNIVHVFITCIYNTIKWYPRMHQRLSRKQNVLWYPTKRALFPSAP